MGVSNSIGKLFVEFGADFSDFAKDIAGLQGEFEKLESKFTKTGTALSLAITAPLAGIGAVALSSFGDFEASLNKVSALQGIFGQDLEKLKQQALDLGAATQFSAKQAADAMGEFAAQGFSATQIYQAMPGALNLAAAGQLKVADAANISAAILKGFNLETSKISDVANVIAKAAGESAVSVQDLGYSFKYVGPVATAAGISFTETAAALAALGNAGIKGEMGGTAIRNMISDLIKPSKQAAETLAALKINVVDATGKLLPMGDVIEKLMPLSKNLTAGFQVFGVRFSEVLPLLKLGKEGFEELNKKMIDASKGQGAATEMAQNLFKGWNAAVETFKGSIETTLIKIGDILAKPAGVLFNSVLTPLLNAIGDLADGFAKLPMPVQAVVLGLGAIAAAAGPAILAIGGIMRAVSDLKGLPEVVNGLGGIFKTMGVTITEWGAAASKAIKLFIAEFSAVNIAQAGANFKNSIVSFASGALDALKSLPANTKTAIAGFVASIGAELASHKEAITTGVSSLFSAIGNFDFGAALSGVGTKIATVVGSITTALSGLSLAGVWSSIVAGFGSIATAISGFLAVAGSVALPVTAVVVAVGALAAIGYEVYKNWSQLTTVFAAFWKDLQTLVSAAAANIGKWIDNALGAGTTSKIAAVWNGFAGWFSGLWQGIIKTIDGATRFIVDQAQRAAFALNMKETAQALANWRDQLDKAAAGVGKVATAAVQAGQALKQAFQFTGLDDAKKKIGELQALVKGTVQAVQTDITFQGLKNSQNDITALKNVLAQLNDAYNALGKAVKEGKISDKDAAAEKAALAQSVQAVKQQLDQLGTTTVPMATAAVGKHKKEVKDTQEVYKTWSRKVQDAIEDLPKSFEAFRTAVSGGFNVDKEVKKLVETLHDMGRAMEDAKTPAEKLKIALKMDELSKSAQQLREFGVALSDTKIIDNMNALNKAANELNSKRDMKNIFAMAGLDQVAKDAQEAKDALKLLGIQIGDVYQKASGKEVKLQALEEMQKAFDFATKNAKELGITTEDLEKAAVKLQKAKTDYYYAELGGIDGVKKAFQALGQVPPPSIEIKGIDPSIKALEELGKQYEILKASGLATADQLQAAELKYLEAKLAAYKKTHEGIKVDTVGLFGFINSKAEESALATQIAFLKGMKAFKDQLSKDFSNVFGDIFSGNFDKALTDLVKLGNNAWKNLKAAFLAPLETAFKSTMDSITKEVTRFVTEQLVGGLLKGLSSITGGLLNFGGSFSSSLSGAVGTTKNLTNVLGGAADQLSKSANNLTAAANTLSKAASIGAQAAGTAGSVAGGASSAVNTASSTIAKSISGVLTNFVAPISAAVSAISGVLSFLGQRRMEQDIGRIEVTTRGILNQLISIQGDVNKYWPNLLNLVWLQTLNFITDVIVDSKQLLEKMLGAQQDTLRALGGGVQAGSTNDAVVAAAQAIEGAVNTQGTQTNATLANLVELTLNVQDLLSTLLSQGFDIEVPALRQIADTITATDDALSGAEQSFSDVAQQADEAGGRVSQAADAISKTGYEAGDAIKYAGASTTELANAATGATAPVQSITSAINDVPKSAGAAATNLTDAADALQQTAGETEKATKATKEFRGITLDTSAAVAGANVVVDKNRRAYVDLSGALASAGPITKDLADEQKGANTQTKNLGEAVAGLAAPMEHVAQTIGTQVEVIEASAEHYENKLADIGKKMSVNVNVMDQAQAAMEAMGVRLAGTAEENRREYLRIYMEMNGLVDDTHTLADALNQATGEVQTGLVSVGNAVTEGTQAIANGAQQFTNVAGVALGYAGDVLVGAAQTVAQGADALSGSVVALGNQVAGAAAAATAAMSAGPMMSGIIDTTPTNPNPLLAGTATATSPGGASAALGGPVSLGTFSGLTGGGGGGGGGAATPEAPAAPKAAAGEISFADFNAGVAAGKWSAGKMGTAGGIIPLTAPTTTGASSGGTAATTSLTPPGGTGTGDKNAQTIADLGKQQMALAMQGTAESFAEMQKIGAQIAQLQATMSTSLSGTAPASGGVPPGGTAASSTATMLAAQEAKVQAQIDALNASMAQAMGSGFDVQNAQMTALQDSLKQIQAQQAELATASTTTASALSAVATAVTLPTPSGATPASGTVPAAAYSSSPNDGGGLNSLAITVNVNNADADKIAQIIIERVRRATQH